MILQQAQISHIRNYLAENGLETPEVLDDLQDHLCCLVEEKIKQGLDFEAAFDKVTMIVVPEDVQEIQLDTIYYLTIKSKIMLVKGIFITAFLSVFCYVLGSIMYNLLVVAAGNHDPQLATLVKYLLQTLGLVIFGFGFLPFLFRFGYQQFVARLQQ